MEHICIENTFDHVINIGDPITLKITNKNHFNRNKYQKQLRDNKTFFS
jgi:hypothetical protein